MRTANVGVRSSIRVESLIPYNRALGIRAIPARNLVVRRSSWAANAENAASSFSVLDDLFHLGPPYLANAR